MSQEEKTEERKHQDLRGLEDDYAPDSNFRRSLATALERRARSPEWHTPLFSLVQVLRGDEDFVPLDDAGAWERCVALMARLVYADGRCGGDPWRDYLGVSAGDAEAEFRDLWGRIRCPFDWNPLEEALRRADAEPLPIGRKSYARSYIRFVSLCAYAQVAFGAKPVGLPQEVLAGAGMLNLSQRNVSRYIAEACRDGFLRRVDEPKYAGGKGKGRCATCLVDLSRWPQLERRSAPGTGELFRGESPPRPPKAPKGPDPADDIVEAYHRLVRSRHTCPGEAGPVRVLLNAGVPFERLMRAVEGFAKACEGGPGQYRTDPNYRVSLMRFFSGGARMWEDFAGEAGG